jgi:transposase
LQLLLARRRDLITDQSRTIARLREALLSLFPALERALDLNSKGPLTLLTHYQTPAQLRRAGHKRIACYLRNRGVKGSNNVAQKALSAAKAQSVTLPAQEVASRIVAELAGEILALKERIESIDEELRKRFFARPEARILTSLPGMGLILGAEFLVAVGDLCAFSSADRLAAYAGLVPAARNSGKRVGKHRRMRGGNKTLKRVFYQSAFASLCGLHRSPGPSTSARGPRARGTPRLSSPWHVGGSTLCGQCCVTEPRSRPALRLDIFIEILLGNSVNSVR